MPHKLVIKKHRNRNEYLLTEHGLWVRDFTRLANPVDINHLISESDERLLINNQMQNLIMHLPTIDSEVLNCKNLVIVSDGYKMLNKLKLIEKIPNLMVIGVNGSLARWENGKMDYYLVNNPYQECLSFLPERYFPPCIASSRTNAEFVRRYKKNGLVYQYTPVSDGRMGNATEPSHYYVDDYRNSICAVIALAFRWNVRKILFLCCDNAFEGDRPSAEMLENGLFMYPQHHIGQDLIEANIFWLLSHDKTIKVADHSSGPKYNHIKYIKEDEIREFFR